MNIVMGPSHPWPQAATPLLVDVLLGFEKMPRLDFRQSVLADMGRDVRSQAIDVDTREIAEARAHVQEILHIAASRSDPLGVLESLLDALARQAPRDGALPWLSLTLLSLTRPVPLPVGDLLHLIEALRALPVQPRPEQLTAYVTRDSKGLSLLTGRETLPEVLVRMLDRRGNPDPAELLGFLRALSADEFSPLHTHLAPLRRLLDQLGTSSVGNGSAFGGGSRLIVQIRLEAIDAEHVEDGRYRMQASYYRQPLSGGPMERIGTLEQTESLSKSELMGAGSARLARWPELARAVRGFAGAPVRIEFLLPAPLLGHPTELWSAGAARRPLGHHHPVVIRSLERYIDPWLNPQPWHDRWKHLQHKSPDTNGANVFDLIGWPSLCLDKPTDLAVWVADRPHLACMGLALPYEELDPAVQEAVDDALFTEGMPVLLWRRGGGDPTELVEALREHSPTCLAELPETVHHCRKRGRIAGADDVRNNITLLWDDPDCVDPDQDSPFAGML
ncbi:DUF1631 domain-containing protein [Streptomyces phaeochromogenes]|nr:DUF1631 domain-containing protein [Streptomyces phaeochromogenes]